MPKKVDEDGDLVLWVSLFSFRDVASASVEMGRAIETIKTCSLVPRAAAHLKPKAAREVTTRIESFKKSRALDVVALLRARLPSHQPSATTAPRGCCNIKLTGVRSSWPASAQLGSLALSKANASAPLPCKTRFNHQKK